MRFDVSTTVPIDSEACYRIVCDMAYLIPAVDPDVASVEKQTDGPLDAGTRWRERISVPFMPGLVIGVALELVHFEPGRSVTFTFQSRVVSGVGTSRCTPTQGGTELRVEMDGKIHGVSRLLYPLIACDFRNRESRRIETFRRKVESGELRAADAEPPPGMPS